MKSRVGTAPKGTGFELRGDCRKLFSSTEHEVVLAGAADTGKTVASCLKVHLTCALIPNVQGSIVRKTYSSLVSTVLRTFGRIIKGQGVQIYGGETPSRYLYKNGSVIWIGGMDNPDRVLSSERDFIYVNQCEELTLADWETLATRCSGRAAVVQHPQLFGDCNPSGSKHWIRTRAAENRMRLLNATHRDNPTIYDERGELTADGKLRLAVLQNLSGVRRKRLLEGIWATAEGAVYENFDVQEHVKVRDRVEMRRFFLALDEGYTNPAVILVVGEDGDGRWHVFREFYQTGMLQETILKTTLLWQREWKTETVAVDESAAGLIADLKACRCRARGGKGRVVDGIARIQNRLDLAGDGRPRLTVDPSCTNLINEFESYVWAVDKPKDTPIKEHDHALDALRYLDNVLSEPTGAWSGEDILASSTGWKLPAGEIYIDPIDYVDAQAD